MRKKYKGMKIGASHSWNYQTGKWNERKIGPRKWTFTYQQSKTRAGRKAPYGSGMPIGSRLDWRIRARQTAVKVSPNKYLLTMKGIKTQAGYKLGKGKKKWNRSKRRW